MIIEVTFNILAMIFQIFQDFVSLLFSIQIPLFLDSTISLGDLILMLLYTSFILGILLLVFTNKGD